MSRPTPLRTEMEATLDRIEAKRGLSSGEVCRSCSADVDTTFLDTGRVVHVPASSTIYCRSCGYSVAAAVAGIKGFDLMGEDELKMKWSGWTRERQQAYLDLLDFAKRYEVKPRQAASWAAQKVTG